ncbi:unnamed protein product [Diatraea saccharalis]|uniref:Uncharacterized protein n=1 Tax=Diatraea saccharalis TaxID=40085 RepID=A0A9N9QUA4_9NEOP|nr:unnamed protein product [Diatraea saccharalis]
MRLIHITSVMHAYVPWSISCLDDGYCDIYSKIPKT